MKLKVNSENLLIPRGKVLFGRFAEGTQQVEEWIDFGNCPSFTIGINVSEIDSKESISGQLQIDDVFIAERNVTFSLATDDLGPENLKHWFHLTPDDSNDFDVVAETLTLTAGNYIYSLANFPASSPTLIGSISGNLTENIDYVFNRELNVIQFDDIEDSTVSVNYLKMRSPSVQTLSVDKKGIEGELRFASSNPVGRNFSLFIHRVSLTPSSDMTLIDDAENVSWGRVSFQGKALLKSGNKKFFTIRFTEDVALEYEGMALIDAVGSVYIV